ncbi:hemerythrin domain-containing protein [Kingella negevensis]|uniref:Iron-sulfur cluster repair protein DnrN n=1 Tax=Kingella negevensis TaxID=1522312 RepID=A0A238HHU2_9NEIS|nr:hemerythrin domain-containing protein [Kingella negevensis]MDK4679646.1 hemerythrin domain-containing protein [Kingella negevensis]MDK4682635.1 hemerythrin domain-containing protein [Kingella negevensis]MDK4684178.1 hemerythrin domain-containing protein [Kingella negevensis]MDK4689459.1 hemerythrin domain-containing protein [Kingella negevensis]MDK4690832.1 hemerythrin domain-containing protein [Kingella negevensis]
MTDQSVWQNAPLPATVDHVLERFHETHRRQFASIIPLAQKVSERHADKVSADLLPLVQHIEAELASHMMKEERMLFPMIKGGMGRNAGMPIRVMMMEHEDHSAVLQQLFDLTDNLTPPADACNSWQRLYAELREFADDLLAHIDFENNLLFPRALNEEA